MLRTLLTWHLTATAAMLAAYLLVVGVQWSAARLSGLADGLRRRSPAPSPAAVPTPRREDEGAPASPALTGAA